MRTVLFQVMTFNKPTLSRHTYRPTSKVRRPGFCYCPKCGRKLANISLSTLMDLKSTTVLVYRSARFSTGTPTQALVGSDAATAGSGNKAWSKLARFPSCYLHAKLELCPMVCVDVFQLAGPDRHLEEGFDFNKKSGLVIGDAKAPGLFLGCIRERFKMDVDGRNFRGFHYNMESYLDDTVKRYRDLVRELTGQTVNLLDASRVRKP